MLLQTLADTVFGFISPRKLRRTCEIEFTGYEGGLYVTK
jgi:hypothetical protein